MGAYSGHIKYQQVHGNKPMSGARSISQLQTWISTIKLVEKYETANWSLTSLRQGDEEVNKRIKQKIDI